MCFIVPHLPEIPLRIFSDPLGIPAAFWYFLAEHSSRINPPLDENIEGPGGEDHVVVSNPQLLTYKTSLVACRIQPYSLVIYYITMLNSQKCVLCGKNITSSQLQLPSNQGVKVEAFARAHTHIHTHTRAKEGGNRRELPM